MKSINQYIQEKLVLTKNIIDKNSRKNYLQFKALEDSVIFFLSKTDPNIEYSFDGKEWIEWDYSDIKLNKDQIVYMRGDNPNGFNSSSYKYNYFIIKGKIEASGNIMSLLYKYDFEDKKEIPCKYCFYNLFNGCRNLLTAPELPATKLTEWCYFSMFKKCELLIKAPELPATKLAESCYYGMFRECTSITTAPKLPATTLGEKCYYCMFSGCELLTQAPELPATELVSYCYAAMFYKCKSLKQKPKIAADINNSDCDYMFDGCPCKNN